MFDQFALDRFSESELSNIEVVAKFLTTPAGKTIYKEKYLENLANEREFMAGDDWDERTDKELKSDARNGALNDVCSFLGIEPTEVCPGVWPYTPSTFNSTVARSKRPEVFAKVLSTSS